MIRNWFSTRPAPHRALSSSRFRCPPRLERLEDRSVPSVVTVDAGQAIRTVNSQVLGVNLAWWDSALNTTQTQQMVQAAGLNLFRFPGGSSSDTWHFNNGPTYNGEGTSPSMASFIASVGGTGMVTLNYGTGSPQEAAAFLAYLNARVGDTTTLGAGLQWSDASNSWVSKDWQTAGYWAGLRAATPLAQDDGLNFLRIGRAAPFGIHYFEVGNEEYGSWETDHHATPHDAATYVAFAKQFAGYAAQIDPSISIGLDTGSVNGDNNWTPNVLQQCASQGFTPGFLSDHSYMQAPGSESDSTLLLHTVSDPNSSLDWAVRASGYRSLLQQKLGAAAANVELLATEFNSVYSNPGKQSTSLVNGLFVADSLGSLLETEYNGANVWDLRNGWDTGNNNSAGLYGWRQGGDYGLLGSGGTAPATGTYVPYPTYFAEQLVSKMVHTGDTVVQASSDDPNLAVYAVKELNGHLGMLVINKNATTDLAEQFNVAGFTPSGQATLWQYGKAQDTAQSQTTDGHSALANSSVSLMVNGSSFSYLFPQYSMTVLDLTPVNEPIDPGFETPAVGTGTYNAFQYQPSGSPWTFNASSGVAGNGSGFTSGNPTAPQGTQVAFLQGFGSVHQSVIFAAGTYSLSFSAAQRGNFQASSQTFQVLVDGVAVGTFTPTGTAYAAFTTNTFTVAAGAHTIAFVGLDPDGKDNTAFIDRVQLTLLASINDPGFELPHLGTGSSAYQYNPSGSPWTFVGSSGVAGNGSAFTGGNPSAPEGTQVAFLQGFGSVRQSVIFAAGTYSLSFSAAQRGNFQASSQTFQVLVDGVAVGTFTPTGTAYAAFTTNTFTVAAGAHTIAFVGLDPDGKDNTAFIDQVQLLP